MTPRNRAPFAVASLLLIGGCAHVADRLTPTDVRSWRPGITHESALIDALGPPADRAFLPDGDVLLRWRGNIGVRTDERLAYGFVVTRAGLLVRRASPSEMHAPPL